MLNIYILTLAILIGIIIICLYKVKKNTSELVPSISRLLFSAICTVGFIWLDVVSQRELIALIGFSFFTATINWLLLNLMEFVFAYAEVEKRHKLLQKLIVWIVRIDVCSMIGNIFFHHVFTMEKKMMGADYVIYVAKDYTFFYYAHLLVSYIIVVRIMALLIRRIRGTSRFYRKKYTVVLGFFVTVIFLDAISVAFHSLLNPSIFFYGTLAISLCYFSIYSQPRQLIADMQNVLMQNLRMGIICFDDKGKCIYANDGLFLMFDIEKSEMVMKKFTYETFIRDKKSDNDTSWIIEREVAGETKYYEIELQKIYDEKIIFVGSCFQITDRTEQERFHQREVGIANEANRAKTEFLSRISHDIRTPMNSISGMNEMIMRNSKEKETLTYTKNINESVNIILNILNDVLDFSKIESGKMTIVEREYDTAKILRSVIEMIRQQAERKELQFICKVAEDLPQKLYGDDVRIVQVLINLLSNAVKYTPKGSITLRVEFAQEERNLFVSVRDTGIGIKQEDIPKLFNAYERFEESKNHSIQGTGLGLNITAHILKLMGSRLEIESVYGEGSEFMFSVKQQIVDATPIGDITEVKKEEEEYVYRQLFEAPDARILVVDDNEINRFVFVNLLTYTKVQIDEAAGGIECLEMTRKNHYDVIFMDHMMPDLDGIETFHQMKLDDNNLCKDVPVIALTANVVAGAKEMYLQEGFQGYLTKPFDPQQIEKVIRDLLPNEYIKKG